MRVFICKKDTLIRIAAFAIIITGAVVYTAAAAKKDTATFGSGVVTAADTEQKAVALTFDTSFGEDRTLDILETLERHGAVATFAVMGAWASEYPELVREIDASGHEIISHSMAHERYDDIGAEAAVADANAARELLRTDFNIRTDMLRPPYGNGRDEVLSALGDAGFEIVGWSVDSKDWKGDDAERISSRVLAATEPGSVILFQNNAEGTPGALDLILEALADRAYSTLTVSELMELSAPETEDAA